MAGIGFALRQLTRRSDYLGLIQAYGHAALITSGPWLMTIAALAAINIAVADTVGRSALAIFRAVIIYNFCFTLCLTAPVAYIATRQLSDMIYRRSIAEGPSILLGSFAVVTLAGMFLSGGLYLLLADLPLAVAIAAMVNFLLVGGVWIVSVFLTALKDYTSVGLAFALGMALAVGATLFLLDASNLETVLWSFNTGLAAILFFLIGRILIEYPDDARQPLLLVQGARDYWTLGLIGLLYNLASWSDKWVMWTAPEASTVAGGLVFFHLYDGAMFYAYLTMIPALAMFTVAVETRFFQEYQKFYEDIRDHAPLARIRANHQRLMVALFSGMRSMFVIQAAMALVLVLMAPALVELLRMEYRQLSIFRFGVVGAMFHTMVIMATIVLAYFDLRRDNLILQSFFLVSNLVLTWATMELGFRHYGQGYLLATLASAALGFILVQRRLTRLPYVTFIMNNASVRRARS